MYGRLQGYTKVFVFSKQDSDKYSIMLVINKTQYVARRLHHDSDITCCLFDENLDLHQYRIIFDEI